MKGSTQIYDAVISRIIADIYTGCVNMGLITDHIPAGCNTADFDLPNDRKLRVKEERNTVYYSIFRAK